MASARPCFHCGEALPTGAPIYARLGDVNQPVCCLGCKAVAEFIQDSGLQAFYEHRSTPDEELGLRAVDADWQHYDSDELVQRYVHREGSQAEASIDIGGMYCSACVWLLDNALQRLDAIDDLSVNPATRRAVIRWNIERLSFAELLAAIARVGFKPQPTAAGLANDNNADQQRTALRRLVVAAAAGMQVMMFAVALYAGDFYGIEAHIQQFLRVISLLVCLPIVFYSARPFFTGALRGLRARSPGMDVPVAIAILAAFIASTRATLLGTGDIYFDSVAMFVLFLSATRYLEMRVRHRADDQTQALARLLPETVTRVVNGQPEVVTLDRIRAGDTVLLRPGDVIPADGTILSGELAIDESLLTGESMPVIRKSGMGVFAGSINRIGNASLRVTLTGASTSLAEIGRLLERAKADRPRVAQLADRIASKFVLAVLGIAAITGAVWLQLDPARAFEVVLATLVVTCPCALALATPAALAAAASRLARRGFLLVRSRVLDVFAEPSIVVFDKTGTLTEGRPAIVSTQIYVDGPGTEDSYLRLAATIESASEHVLARAFSGFYDSSAHRTSEAATTPGCGVEATVDGACYRIGSFDFVSELCGEQINNAGAERALSSVYLASETDLLARFDIADELRADARSAIDELRELGHDIVLASGDRAAAVANAAGKLGIEDWHAELTPAGKLELIAGLQAAGRRVLMVGDGINDAPVLAAADASIAIDAGTALARASADAVVLGKRVGTLTEAARLAIRTRRTVRQNIGWAIAYNLTAVPLAASGVLAPWMSAIGMSLSSLIVVANALRLQQPSATERDALAAAADNPSAREATV